MTSRFPLNWVYRFLKAVVRVSLGLFYPNTVVMGREHLRLGGPTLVATNHPNTLIDALNAGLRVDGQVFFLVNSSLYSSPWQAKVFETLYCIPIERPQDTQGRPVHNQAAFERCYRHLGRGGHLFVAPEGGSEMEYHLRRIKTGTARIALGAEAAQDFRGNVRILPIGCTYGDPPRLGSSLLVNAGEPIYLKDYEDLYRENPRRAVLKVTETLRQRLSSQIFDTRDAEEEALLVKIRTLLRHQEGLPLDREFQRLKALLPRLRQWQADDPAAYDRFRARLAAYYDQLEQAGGTDAALARPGHLGLRGLGLLLGLPFFALGAAANALPYHLPRWALRKLDLYIGYAATVKILLGLLTFPLSYLLLFLIALVWLPLGAALALTAAWFPLGVFAWNYARWYRQALARWRLRRLGGAGLASLRADRASLLATLEALATQPALS